MSRPSPLTSIPAAPSGPLADVAKSLAPASVEVAAAVVALDEIEEDGLEHRFNTAPSSHAGVERRRAFVAGRIAARSALESLGESRSALTMRPNGAPDWPTGVTGSITHDDDFALAVACRTDRCAAIGVDLASINIAEALEWRRFVSPEERQAVEVTHAESRSHLVAALLAAREAGFKALSTAGAPVPSPWDLIVDTRHENGVFVVTDPDRMYDAVTRAVRWSERIVALAFILEDTLD